MMTIISVANGDMNRTLPFLKTLKETGYSGRVFFASETCKDKRFHEAHIVPVVCTDHSLDSSGVSKQRCQWFTDIMYRFVDKDEQVVIADSFDCVFQRNPEETMFHSHVNVAEEAIYLDECNAKWIDASSVSKWFKHMKVICAGVMWGQSGHLTRVLDEMNFWRCPDQGALNIVARRDQFTTVHSNGGPVWHLGCEFGDRFHLKNFDGEEDGLVRTLPWNKPTILHQWERSPSCPHYLAMKQVVQRRVDRLLGQP